MTLKIKLDENWDIFGSVLKKAPELLLKETRIYLEKFGKVRVETLTTKISTQSGEISGLAELSETWKARKTQNVDAKLLHLGKYVGSFEYVVDEDGKGVSWGTDAIQALALEFGYAPNNLQPRPHVVVEYYQSINEFIENYQEVYEKIFG